MASSAERPPTDYRPYWQSQDEAMGQWATDSGHAGQAYWDWGKERAADVAKYLPADPHAYTRAVDYGCGLGRVIRHVPASQCYGIDASPEHLKLARQLSPGPEYLLTDGRHIPLVNSHVDLVYSFQVLQHVDADDVAMLLAETRRVLKVGGCCYHTFARFGEPWRPGLKLERAPLNWQGQPAGSSYLVTAIDYPRAVVRTLALAAGLFEHEVLPMPGGGGCDYWLLLGRRTS